MNRFASLPAAAALLAATSAWAGQPIRISEIRIDQPSTDNDEYFELSGPQGASLDGLTYIVIGDGATASGTIEAVVDLTGESLDGNGFFVAAEETFTLGVADLTLAGNGLNFENNDNVTHMLVSGFTGAVNDDIDDDDDGVPNAVLPWASIVDAVGLVDETGAGDQLYGATFGFLDLGPDGAFVPGHVYLCNPDLIWTIGLFDTAGGDDTPGAVNLDCPPDLDGDGVPNDLDNCPEDFNPAQCDCNGDGVGDVCEIADGTQFDVNLNGIPDECEGIVINEVLYDPAPDLPGDANGDGVRDASQDEFIEIVNNTGAPLDLTDWTLSDSFIVRHVFPAGTVVPDQCAVVVFGGGIPIGGFGGAIVQIASEGSGFGLNNDTDDVVLQDDLADVRAFYRYGLELVADESLTRDPDITGGCPMVAHSGVAGAGGALFSPGTQTDGSPFPGCSAPVDSDGDGVIDPLDNCPNHQNPDQADCDGDGMGDVCAIATGMSQDCNFTDIPDECEIADGTSQDCNQNGIPDECDLAQGVLHDVNANQVPDECEIVPPANLRINEVRIEQPNADDDEYFELKGDPGTPLTGLRYIVIGDSTEGGSGVIECIVNLDGLSIPANDGHFLAVEDTYTLTDILTINLLLSGADNRLNFEGSDNVTHVLVANFYGTIGQDLDINDDGVLNVTPWLAVIDAVGFVESDPPVGTEFLYAEQLGGSNVGPEGIFVPGQAFRCETAGTWRIGPFDPAAGVGIETPGALNIDCVPGCTGDLDANDDVGFSDLLVFLSEWGPCPPSPCNADYDMSGDVGFSDLLIFLASWGPCF